MKSPNKLDAVTRGRSILTRHASANLSLLSLTALVLWFRPGSARAGWGLPQGDSFPVASLSSQQRLERGKELMKQRKFAEAAAEFRELLRTEPNSPFIYNLLGFCALQQGLREEAVTYFKKAVELDPGGLLLSYGKEEAAVEHLRRVQGVEPKAGEVLYALAVDYFKKQDFKAALRLLEMVGPSMQNSAAWHDLVGESHFKLGEPV